jgi:hypothetical protein
VSLDEEWVSPAWLSTGSSCPDWGFRCAAKIKGFAKFEIVAEFGAGLSLAISDPRGEASARPHLLAQRTDEISVLGEPLELKRENGSTAFNYSQPRAHKKHLAGH